MPKKILVALSGGVDSAVAAMLLKDRGFDVSAAYMRTWMNEPGNALFADCPWEEDIASAKEVSRHLGIPFEVINLIDAYKEKVVKYLVDGYKSGITPNPDIMCNREMKFGIFREFADNQGFDGIATGHYCRIQKNVKNTYEILEGSDKNKDQSYFLAMVRQKQIQNAYFPIGEIEKPKVRSIAQERSLPNAHRKDSQGICFLGKVNIRDFLKQYIPDKPGNIVRQADGKILGKHQGLHKFTLGQRKGIGIPSNTDFKNYIVVSKDLETNDLVVAFEEEDTPNLYQSEVNIRDISWVSEQPTDQDNITAKPRYRDPAQQITFQPTGETTARIQFTDKQRALANGQTLALYQGDRLLGGGYYY